MIKAVLWDVDGTLLNFEKSEKYALNKCFSIFHLGECTDEMIVRYSEINRSYWQALEAGKITKKEVLINRFRDFFEKEHIKFEQVSEFNEEYQIRLGDKYFFNDNAYELMKKLQGKVKQYAVTNGTHMAQKRKLENSGLDKLFDDIFISDDVGIDKPNIEYFDHVERQIGGYDKQEMMIVGDSLTSDIQGGNNAGILCCWYNPSGKKTDKKLRIDYEISDLHQVEAIISGTCSKIYRKTMSLEA
ncbi:MAG: noncanonical pyrimidine nucleotidase, YjjG family [Clostridia bacterium]|nr:noncanonical pyrimidine nucleotidase, YjjG family [Clostridia bacterium]NCC43134.1 noncanonical pyrimidine nucleotidase, YjjG family [Clostridia bacterium]